MSDAEDIRRVLFDVSQTESLIRNAVEIHVTCDTDQGVMNIMPWNANIDCGWVSITLDNGKLRVGIFEEPDDGQPAYVFELNSSGRIVPVSKPLTQAEMDK